MKRLTLFMIIILLFSAAPVLANNNNNNNNDVHKEEPVKDKFVLPVDEAAKNPAFFTFRRELIKALIARDHEAVRAMMSPNLKYSFGEQRGNKALKMNGS